MRNNAKRIATKLAEGTMKKAEVLLKADNEEHAERLLVGDLEIDIASGTVYRSGKVLDLPELSFRLLRSLATRAPALVGKDDLISEVWGDVVVSDETLTQRVRLLRQAIRDDSLKPRYVVSVRGRGYRMAAPVRVRASRPGARPGWQRRWPWMVIPTLVAMVWLYAGTGRDFPEQSVGPQTLAVLPFTDLSEDGSYGYFADGMQEELLTRLATVSEIAVLSRTSTEQFRGRSQPVPVIARALDVNSLVQGSVRVSDDRLRIAVQLIAGETGAHIWADTFDEPLTVKNVFAIQERVADRVATALQAAYQRRPATFGILPTTDIDAYNAFLLGRYHTLRPTPGSLALGIRYLQTAIDRDPGFAEAIATLGWAYLFQGSAYGNTEPGAVIPKARDAALKALELDDTLSLAHSLYADVLTWYDRDFLRAEAAYQRAMALDPYDLISYALFLSTQLRHDEAIAMMETLKNRFPNDEFIRINTGWRYLHAGQPDEAVEAALQARDHSDANNLMGSAYLAMGDYDAALEAFTADTGPGPPSQADLTNLAYTYVKLGRFDDARIVIRQIEGHGDDRYASRTSLAAIHLALGEEDRGFQLLNDAVDARERSVIFLNVSPLFADWRRDARFIATATRAGLPLAP